MIDLNIDAYSWICDEVTWLFGQHESNYCYVCVCVCV